MKKIFLFILLFLFGSFMISCDKEQINPEVTIIIDLIDQLPEKVSLENEEDIISIQDRYNLLSSSDKEKVTNYQVLENKIKELENLKIEQNNQKLIIEVINAIASLPKKETITIEDEEKIVNVRMLYDALESNLKAHITNLETLVLCEETLKVVKQNHAVAEEVIELIDTLPTISDLKLSDKEAILNVQETFDRLSDSAKELVLNKDKLNNLLKIVIKFDDVETVIYTIDNLPYLGDLTLNDEEEVLIARELYEQLDSDVKHYVNNISILEEYEEKIKIIKSINDSANKVISIIDNLPSVELLKLSDKISVENARNCYENLSDEAKVIVINITKLKALEEQIEYLEQVEVYKDNANLVINLINNLPDDITLENEEQINNCISAYENLLQIEKEMVTNYNKLIAAKQKIEEIIANTNYKVKVELNGGYLENMIEIEKNEIVLEFVVNNYSSNIWTVYSNNIFIYKKTLMNIDDQFTNFLKVGLTRDSLSEKYNVSQIISPGTALEESKRICDYYILVHSDYNEGYSKVNQISLNNQIKIDKELPETATSSLNATISLLRNDNQSDYYIELTGLSTLPIPVKTGYKFIGWYLEKDFINKVTEVKNSTTVYARWTQDKGEITTENILNSVSDIATSDTIDELISENEDATFIWSSSNSNLYNIKDGLGTVSKMYQTHKKQTVTINCEIKYKTGGSKTVSKTITVNPIKFTEFSSTPIATYFYTGAVSAYKKYNERYLSDQTMFSDTTKETLDIVYYAFIVPNSDGSVSFQNTSYLEEVRELRNHNVRILGCVNGVGTDTSTAFKVITADANLRKTFISNLMDLVEEYNLDGLDLDWEAISSSLKPIASQYNLLCEELRAEMTRRQDEGGSPYLLTMAVPASSYGTATDRFDFKTLNNYVDYINIMSYDLNHTAKASHLSPLYTSSKDNGYGFGAVYGVNRISSLGFDKNKLIIGCAGYGKAYKVSSGSGTLPALGTSGTLTKISGYDGSFASGTVYGSVINQLLKSGNYKQYTELDSNGKVVGSYLYSATDQIFITFDSKEAVMAKYEYASSMGVGMMCWAYTEDTSDTVINAIYEAKNK